MVLLFALQRGLAALHATEHKGRIWTEEHDFTSFLCPNATPSMFCYCLRSDVQISMMQEAQKNHRDGSNIFYSLSQGIHYWLLSETG